MDKIRTILYAEDDLVVLTAYQARLQQAGFHVISARDGIEAIKRLSAFVPDLLLLDLMLPKFDGADVLRFMDTNAALGKVPVIILSTNSVSVTAHENLLGRAQKRLLKSQCTAKILLAAIEEVLAGAAAPRTRPAADQI
jgi:DNA-binding response OmpR family regulator